MVEASDRCSESYTNKQDSSLAIHLTVNIQKDVECPKPHRTSIIFQTRIFHQTVVHSVDCLSTVREALEPEA